MNVLMFWGVSLRYATEIFYFKSDGTLLFADYVQFILT